MHNLHRLKKNKKKICLKSLTCQKVYNYKRTKFIVSVKSLQSNQRMKGQQDYQEIAKFLVIGDANVGKTSVIKSFCNGEHNTNEAPTNTLQYGQKILVLSGKKVLFQIWDTSVNENFRLLMPSLYSSVMGVLVVFSVDNRNSFNSVAVWMKQIQTFAPQNLPIILVCNKADLTKKQVSQRQAQALSEAINIDLVMVSARKQINIEDTIIRLYQKRKRQILGKHQKKKQQQKKERFSIFKCNF